MSNTGRRRPQHRVLYQYPTDHAKPKERDDPARFRAFHAYRRGFLRASRGCEFRDPDTGRRCWKRPVTLHHKAGREGENLFRHPMAACLTHHGWIHAHEDQSRAMGYLIEDHATPDIANDDPIFTPVARKVPQ